MRHCRGPANGQASSPQKGGAPNGSGGRREQRHGAKAWELWPRQVTSLVAKELNGPEVLEGAGLPTLQEGAEGGRRRSQREAPVSSSPGREAKSGYSVARRCAGLESGETREGGKETERVKEKERARAEWLNITIEVDRHDETVV